MNPEPTSWIRLKGENILLGYWIEEGYALYKYENGSDTLYSIALEDIARRWILLTN